VLYSILLATLGRTNELDQFLRSLAAQTLKDFELVVVDQNANDCVERILKSYSRLFPIVHLRCRRGHSRAFNTGLERVRGEIVAFPDDDCWYDSDLLSRVARLLKLHSECSGVTGREVVEPGFICGGRWDSERGFLTRKNIFGRAITFTMFLRSNVARQYSFDETMGVGADTRWGAGEETDYLLQMMQDGHLILYDPSITVWHQGRSGPYTTEIYSKARSYGMGMGRILQKHQYPLRAVARHLIRPAGGALQSLVLGRPRKARYHWSIFAGRFGGWARNDPSQERQVQALVSSREDLT
jgi:glycosyltransferase involved in cell wall biosynthesis